ncbi:MAG TPA: hypothetical protein P5050_09785 [Bacteroidia bacterium]|nr:hypothetical protein [Bacteroidia bacterium]HRS59499.1 hypothetical protein [Bacteroidia bacterium]HRU67609.1 hypothetical protein [Bacteroidia bacterium]
MSSENIFILRGVDFELGFHDFYHNEIRNEINSFFNSRQYQISNKEFSYRIINHWEKNDLLTTSRRDGSGWRKYSVMDRIWVYIIREMRNFEISLNIIQKVKQSLTQKKKDSYTFPILEYYIAQAMLNKPVFLMIFSGGQAHPVTDREIQMNREFNASNNHLQINLNQILQKVFPEKNLKVKYKDPTELNLEEKRAVLLIRMGNFKELEITGKNIQKDTYIPENVTKAEEICNLILKKSYKTLRFTLYTGKVFSVNNE